MTIKAGDNVPATTLHEMGADGPVMVSSSELFSGKKVLMFGLPGAFTPTCSAQHLPGYIRFADDIKAKGIDEIVCFSVNDAFVMGAWSVEQGVDGRVRMIGDGSAEFSKATGLDLDLNARGFGVRCKRFAMVVDDGKVISIDIEPDGEFSISSAESQLGKL